MEIKDLVGLKEPLTKLVELVAKGIGVIYEPTKLRRKALAEADALKIKSAAIEEVIQNNPTSAAIALVCENDKLELKALSDFSERASASKAFREAVEQRNIENVVTASVKYLGSSVSQQEVDPDWRTRFFEKSKGVSQEQMQEVWAKVLAGEVTQPGSYSLRTLELLSNLEAKEAEDFRKLSTYIERNSGFIFLHHKNVNKKGFNSDFPFAKLLILEDCGLLMSKYDLGLDHEFLPKSRMEMKFNHGSIFIKNSKEIPVKHRLSILKLTTSGKELLSLVDSEVWTDAYEDELKKSLPADLELQYLKKV